MFPGYIRSIDDAVAYFDDWASQVYRIAHRPVTLTGVATRIHKTLRGEA